MIYDDIQRLISYALKNELIAQEDIYVIRNQLMEVFQLDIQKLRKKIFRTLFAARWAEFLSRCCLTQAYSRGMNRAEKLLTGFCTLLQSEERYEKI